MTAMISEQAIGLAAWQHEARGPHGRWVKGPSHWEYVGMGVSTGLDVHHPEFGHGKITGVNVPKDFPASPLGEGRATPEGSGLRIMVRFDSGDKKTFKVRMMSGDPGNPVVPPDTGGLGGIKYVPRPLKLAGRGLDVLDADDMAGIDEYTQQHVNDAISRGLRSGKLDQEDWQARHAVEELDRAEQKVSLAEDATVYRGIALTRPLARKMKPGATFTDKNYTSVSTSSEWADDFAKLRVTGTDGANFVTPLGGEPVRLEIRLKAGQHIIPGEGFLGEWVLPRSTTYHVDDVRDGTIRLSVVPTPAVAELAGGGWHDAWMREARAPSGEWVKAPGTEVMHEAYGHGVITGRHGRTATVLFSDGTERRFGSLMEHEPQGEARFFQVRVGPAGGDVPDPENLDRKLAPEIPATDKPWGDVYGTPWQEADKNMVPYTTRGNAKIEADLRAGRQPEPPMHPELADQVIASRHLTQPVALYRGIGLSGDLARKLVPGAEFTDKAYTSTTTAPEWADEFARFRVTGTAPWVNKEMRTEPHPELRPARMVLHAQPGQEIGPGEPGLAEYVLPRDSRFRVTRVLTAPDGMTEIHADVLPHGPHAPLQQVERPDPRARFLHRDYVVQQAGALISAQVIDLGWRYNPLEKRNEHGQWTREGGEATVSGGMKYRTPDHARLIRKRARPPDPADHPFFRAHPVSPENVIASYDRAPAGIREQGMRWYADAHSIAKAIAGGDADKGAGVLAAYSPQTAWPANMFNADRALHLGRALGPGDGMITRDMQAHAQRALDGAPADEANHSPKTRAFARLIRNGGDMPGDPYGDVVIDRHAMTVAMGQRLSKKEADGAPIEYDSYYQHVADQYREAARRITERDGTPVAPHQLQAITWLQQQDENEAADISAGTGIAKGRAAMVRNYWKKWGAESRADRLPVHPGTTVLEGAGLISGQVIEMAFNPMEARDSRGRWTKFGGVGEAVRVMEKEREGFSVSPRTGDSPQHGYMVALEGHTHRYPAEILDDPEKLHKAIDDMLMSEREAFQGRDMYLGGWVEDGKLWLDPSQNVQDRAEAERLGRERDQVGIFDLDTFTTIDTGGGGGGRITDHQLSNPAESARGHSGGLLGPARRRTPGGGGENRGRHPGGIAAQVTELAGWHDAWRHELRGRHGEWVKGSVDAERAKALIRDELEHWGGTSSPEEELHAAIKALDDADWHTAISHMDNAVDIASDWGPEDYQRMLDLRSRIADIAAGDMPRGRGVEFAKRAESLGRELSRYWANTEDPMVRGLLEPAMAHWRQGDHLGATRMVVHAAAVAQDHGERDLLDSLGKEMGQLVKDEGLDKNLPESDPEAAAVHKVIQKAAAAIPGMFGPHEHLALDGKPPTIWSEQRPAGIGGTLLAYVDWDGHVGVYEPVARAIREAQENPGTGISDPSSFTVPLHEMIHAVVPEGQDTRQGADMQAYQNLPSADIEEGFTELGTIQHASEFFRKLRIGRRRTPFLKTDEHGDPVVSKEYQAKQDTINQLLETEWHKIDDFRKGPSQPGRINSTAHLGEAIKAVQEARMAVNFGDTAEAVHQMEILQHLGDPVFTKDAIAIKAMVRDLGWTPSSEHLTMAERAEQMNTPKRIKNGDAWGHYPRETARAYQWASVIAQARTGKGEEDPATQREIRRLSDAINAQGTAAKTRVMAEQVIADMNVSAAVRDSVLSQVETEIKSSWEDTDPARLAQWLKDVAVQAAREAA